MIERVVANWLTKINERLLEIPFCQLLAGEGYQVIHLSRHGSFEQGKDIIAIAPDGVPCAFQLKGAPSGKKITQKLWAQEYLAQITRLVEIPIKHPSVDPNSQRRVYFVTNGEIDEEVRVEIEDRNTEWEHRGYPRLRTVVHGELLTRFINLNTNFWPTELTSERELLELFLVDGTDCLNKERLANFITQLVPLSGTPNPVQLSRALACVAVMTTLALSSYSEKCNYVAVFEGWIVYTAHLVAVVEKYALTSEYWRDHLDISCLAIETALSDLCNELIERKHFIEGNALVEQPFYRGRITWLIGLMSAYALWKIIRGEQIEDTKAAWLKNFLSSQKDELLLWGEAAIPQFLSYFWLLPFITADLEPIQLLTSIISNIVAVNTQVIGTGLPDPYILLPEAMEQMTGIASSNKPSINYKGQSYTLEALIHLLARRGWRQHLRWLWPQITRLRFVEFVPDSPIDFCFWRTEAGRLYDKQPEMPQSWEKLKAEARKVDNSSIPKLFDMHRELLLMFMLVYPHRLTKNVAKVMDEKVQNMVGIRL